MNDTSTEVVAGLRALADFVEANPEVAERLAFSGLKKLSAYVGHLGDPKAAMTDMLRKAKAHGAKITKDASDKYFAVNAAWGPVGIDVYADRTEVCERVVTGVQTVTKVVPDPDALAAVPTVEITEQVEQVEWVCRPLLAAEAGDR